MTNSPSRFLIVIFVLNISLELDFGNAKTFVSQDTISGWSYVSQNVYYHDEFPVFLAQPKCFFKR